MNSKSSASKPAPVPTASPLADPGLGSVKVQKREVKPPVQLREKVCATCGRTFQLEPEQKFFNCPYCHRKTHPARKPARKSEAQILTQITCMECGAVEYIDFVPTDVHAAYCSACFAKKRREMQATRPHTEGR